MYQSYVVGLPGWAAPRRAELIERLRQRGIETTIGTYHLPRTAFYAARGPHDGAYPVTDRLAPAALSLPLSGAMRDAEISAVVDALVAELARLQLDAPPPAP